jgi:rhomboid family GlyGly-CTERM serine protease
MKLTTPLGSEKRRMNNKHMRIFMKQKDMMVLIAAMAIVNLPLVLGRGNHGLIFLADRVLDGQWYRFFTAPFVHVSFYHLLIDGLAFVMLYSSLPYVSAGGQLLSLAGIHTAVMFGVAGFGAAELGYCGLSGIDHGLMAVWCLEMMRNRDKTVRYAGLVGLVITAGKSLYEVASGQAAFGFLHLGDIGTPVVWSHMAGVIGGIAVYWVGRAYSNFRNYI